jgi:hypothetical protein
MPWYLASTLSGLEYRARDQLAAAGIENFVPTWKRLVRPRRLRRAIISERPLFDRIILLQTGDIGHDRMIIRERLGTQMWFSTFIDVARKERRYVTVRDAEIENLKARVESGEFDRLERGLAERPVFRIGDHVRFTAGALVDRTGVVEARHNGAKYRVAVGPLSVLAGAGQIILVDDGGN